MRLTGEHILYEMGIMMDVIKTLQQEIDRLQQARYFRSAGDGVRVMTSGRYGAKFEDGQDQIDKIQEKLQKMVQKYLRYYEKAIDVILSIEDLRIQKFLLEKYAQGKTEEELRYSMGVSSSTLYRIQEKSIREFEKWYDKSQQH